MKAEDDALSPLGRPRPRRLVIAKFNAAMENIVVEWVRRSTCKGREHHEPPHAWLKRTAYKILVDLIERDELKATRGNFETDRRSSRIVDESLKNPFKAGLLAMFSDESILSRKNRHVYGNQMAYAWAHDVPYEFLNGFLAVTGGAEAIAQKLKVGFIEPGFEHRFRPERLQTLAKIGALAQ